MYSYNLYQEETLTTPLSRKLNTFNADKANLHVHVTFSTGQTESVFVKVENYDVYTQTKSRIALYELKPTDADSDLTLGKNIVLEVPTINVLEVSFINGNTSSVSLTANADIFKNIPPLKRRSGITILDTETFESGDYKEFYVGDCEGVLIDICYYAGLAMDFCVLGCSGPSRIYNYETYGHMAISSSGNSAMYADKIYIPTADLEFIEFYNLSTSDWTGMTLDLYKFGGVYTPTNQVEVR